MWNSGKLSPPTPFDRSWLNDEEAGKTKANKKKKKKKKGGGGGEGRREGRW